MTTTVSHKTAWTKPGQMRKALAAAVAAVVGPAVIAATDNGHGSVPTLALWLIAALAGLAAFAGVFWFPNDPETVKQVERVADTVAVDLVEHNPAQAAADATVAVDQYWKQMFVKGNATPPEPVVASKEPLSTVASTVPVSVAEPAKPAYTGPVPPVSEPVGATAVSATP